MFFGLEDPIDLYRIVFYLVALFLSFRVQFKYIPELDLLFAPSGFLKWLNLPGPGSWVPTVLWLWRLSLLFSALGLLTRFSTFLAFILGFYYFGLLWTLGLKVRSTHALVICLGIMAFSRTGKRWSLDQKLFKKNHQESDRLKDESWPIRLCQLFWCLIFFSAGYQKIEGGIWHLLDPKMFESFLKVSAFYKESVDPTIQKIFFSSPELIKLTMLATLVVELFSPLAFFYNGWLRFGIVGGLAIMQILAYFVFGVNFLFMLPMYLFWIPWQRLLSWKK